MFLGQDYHTLAQGSEQRVLPEKVTQWFVVLLRKMRAKDRGATQFSLSFWLHCDVQDYQYCTLKHTRTR